MEDRATGQLKPEILDEKVLSAIIEFKATLDRLPRYLQAIDEVEAELDTVVSIGVSSRCAPDGAIPHQAVCLETGRLLSVNGKTNLGLGRPVATG